MTRRLILPAAFAVLAAPLIAAPSDAPDQPPQAYSALIKCRDVQDSAQRLACYDKAVADLQTATQNHQVVMVDREHISKTKRKLFGLPLPDINLFGGKEDEGEEISTVEGVVASAFTDQDNRWRVSLQDGALWQQIDDRPVAIGPKSGDPVVVTKAALGSYMMRIKNRPGIRVRRIK
jgi:hypothetical protein